MLVEFLSSVCHMELLWTECRKGTHGQKTNSSRSGRPGGRGVFLYVRLVEVGPADRHKAGKRWPGSGAVSGGIGALPGSRETSNARFITDRPEQTADAWLSFTGE